MPAQIVRKAVRDQIGLRHQRHLRRQRGAERRLDQRIMRAAEHGRLRRRQPRQQRRHMRPRDLARAVEIARLDRLDQPGAGLRLDRHVAGAELQLAREGARGHRRRRREQRHVAQPGMGRRRVVAPVAPGQMLDHRHEHPEHPPLGRVEPAHLQVVQRHRRGGVAGEHHQPAALGEQPPHPRDGQRIDLLRRPPAVGRVGVVAEIDEILLRQPRRHRAQHGQPAEPAVEDADRHGPTARPRTRSRSRDRRSGWATAGRSRRAGNPSAPARRRCARRSRRDRAARRSPRAPARRPGS